MLTPDHSSLSQGEAAPVWQEAWVVSRRLHVVASGGKGQLGHEGAKVLG